MEARQISTVQLCWRLRKAVCHSPGGWSELNVLSWIVVVVSGKDWSWSLRVLRKSVKGADCNIHVDLFPALVTFLIVSQFEEVVTATYLLELTGVCPL